MSLEVPHVVCYYSQDAGVTAYKYDLPVIDYQENVTKRPDRANWSTVAPSGAIHDHTRTWPRGVVVAAGRVNITGFGDQPALWGA